MILGGVDFKLLNHTWGQAALWATEIGPFKWFTFFNSVLAVGDCARYYWQMRQLMGRMWVIMDNIQGLGGRDTKLEGSDMGSRL